MPSSCPIKRGISMNTYFLPVTQWPAVTTEFSLTKTPPQMCENCTPARRIWRLTDHGHAPVWASCPPTIRDPETLSKSGRCPHSAKQNSRLYRSNWKTELWVHWQHFGLVFFYSTVLLAVGFLVFAAGAWLLEILGLLYEMCVFQLVTYVFLV